MNSLRKASWFPWLSVLLLAVWIPMQAAGCCKLAAVMGIDLASWLVASAKPAPAVETAPAVRTAPAVMPEPITAMAADHSCCRKSSAPTTETAETADADKAPSSDDQGASPCSGGDNGCCMKDAGQAPPGLASTPVSPSFAAAADRTPLQGETPKVAASLPISALPGDPGPPLYLVHQRLLI